MKSYSSIPFHLLSFFSLFLTLSLALPHDAHQYGSRTSVARSAELDVHAGVGKTLGLTYHIGGGKNGANLVHYVLEISEGYANPDGAKERMVYLLNGKFPADPLTIDEGDEVEFVVINNTTETLTMHFHGIEQKGTPWSDGVPGVTQPIIQPGNNFTHCWNATQHGFYFIHSHSKSQQDDGMAMTLYIRPDRKRERPFRQISEDPLDLFQMYAAEHHAESIMIMDWRHFPEYEIGEIWKEANIEPLCVQSILINGKGSSVCPSADELAAIGTARGNGDLTAQGCLYLNNSITNPPAEGFAFEANAALVPDELWLTCASEGVDNPLYTLNVDNHNTSWVMLNLVNNGGLWEEVFSIDEHPMYIIAVEGEYVNTTTPVSAVSLHSGVRVQALVKLTGTPGEAYTIRVAANVAPQVKTGYGILQYASPDPSATPTLVKPAAGYPALPTSTAYIDYSSAALTTATGAECNATIFDYTSDQAAPYVADPPPSNDQVAHTFFLNMKRPNATIWTANGTGLQTGVYENGDPLIWDSVWRGVLEAATENVGPYAGSSLVLADSVYVVPEVGSVVDLIFIVHGANPAHPIHKHFNRFWVMGHGTGSFNWTTVAEAAEAIPEHFNFVNPPKRDGYNTIPSTPEGSWLALRYVVQNPGPQTVHCHISQHAAGGMVAVILQAMEQLELPEKYAKPS
ncbi:Cupredoxin [Desarmillaria tabescens]|uniref:Cupredoxin n=1 Tax=Armillaria tabescens TaxID=1929756 RepID=A0AA39NK78_ARMTA|nr:Cupredoxin [Desarmillaria tabescens]KAK0467199.1 Cupredoxin [Desarmillaria tabescens]